MAGQLRGNHAEGPLECSIFPTLEKTLHPRKLLIAVC
jgi:hypothetical protein